LFEQRFEETFKRFGEGGRKFALWVQYHYMVDVIKNFIKCECLANHGEHFSCIASRMLDTSVIPGHHHYAKGT